MMDDTRLIDAYALLNSLEPPTNWNETPEEIQEVSDYENFVKAIIAAPTVEAEPVRHGRWIQVDGTKCKCSECEVITLIAQYPNGNKNYCPNCGAKMNEDNTRL